MHSINSQLQRLDRYSRVAVAAVVSADSAGWQVYSRALARAQAQAQALRQD
jgi:hypothetical protein